MARYALLPISRHARGNAARRSGLSRSDLVLWRKADIHGTAAILSKLGYKQTCRIGHFERRGLGNFESCPWGGGKISSRGALSCISLAKFVRDFFVPGIFLWWVAGVVAPALGDSAGGYVGSKGILRRKSRGGRQASLPEPGRASGVPDSPWSWSMIGAARGVKSMT